MAMCVTQLFLEKTSGASKKKKGVNNIHKNRTVSFYGNICLYTEFDMER